MITKLLLPSLTPTDAWKADVMELFHEHALSCPPKTEMGVLIAMKQNWRLNPSSPWPFFLRQNFIFLSTFYIFEYLN